MREPGRVRGRSRQRSLNWSRSGTLRGACVGALDGSLSYGLCSTLAEQGGDCEGGDCKNEGCGNCDTGSQPMPIGPVHIPSFQKEQSDHLKIQSLTSILTSTY